MLTVPTSPLANLILKELGMQLGVQKLSSDFVFVWVVFMWVMAADVNTRLITIFGT